MELRSCVYFACTRLIKESSDVKGDIPYMDTIIKVAPKMFDVIEYLTDNIPEDKLGELYDDLEYLSCRPSWSKLTEEDIWGRENDWIDILEELNDE